MLTYADVCVQVAEEQPEEPDDMLAAVEGENLAMTWLLRCLTFCASCAGLMVFFYFLSPLGELAALLPYADVC